MRWSAIVLGVAALVAARGTGAIGQSAGQGGATVSGVVRMPEICAPSVSPAVVYLEVPKDDAGKAAAKTAPAESPSRSAETALVNQKGLQFTPRVQAIALGQSVRFTNEDIETHNVNVITPGYTFNQSMSPGKTQDFTPEKPGVMVLACDVHLHMRGYVVISPTPWVQVCSSKGRFRLEGVPDGRYVLHVWQEMGEPLTKDIVVSGGKAVDLHDLVLAGPKVTAPVAGAATAAPARPWAEVIDRIGMLLAASRKAAARTGEKAAARRLAEDAYWVEFEGSDMEVAVRRFLGFSRAGDLERQFLRYRTEAGEVSDRRKPASTLDDRSHDLLLDLLGAAVELNQKGVTDASHLDAKHAGGNSAGSADLPTLADGLDSGGANADPAELLKTLRRGLHRVGQQAEAAGADDAASELTTVYMTDFEPIERYLLGRSPESIRPLEVRFNRIRGEVTGGLKGEALAGRLDSLYTEVETLIAKQESRPAGAFGTAFVESLVTIVREGVEVILVLAMLIALVVKAIGASPAEADDQANAAATRARGRAMRAIWLGVGLAIVASIATAAALNLMVASVQGRAREVLEGLVMLVAAGVLFYVSYWLVSQAQAKRWADFLRQHARRGLEWGGGGTLALTAFLAVYREGAETALMYQALLGSQGTTRAGLLGLLAGLVLGLLVLTAVAALVRATSVRLPLRAFFQVSGLMLFALAVIFAGNAVFALQNAGYVVTTPLPWLGGGLPLFGLYPSLQVISVQGLLIAGAVLSWLVIPQAAAGDRSPASRRGDATPPTVPPLPA
ncbi:MAG: FTR1 family protein [Isosphaeraceae bacterium]